MARITGTNSRNVEQILFDVAADFGLTCRLEYDTYDCTTRIRLRDPATDWNYLVALSDNEMACLDDDRRFDLVMLRVDRAITEILRKPKL